MASKLFIILPLSLSFIALANSMDSSSSANWQNAEGYINVENNGKLQHFIVVSNQNSIKLISVDKDPSMILKNKTDIINRINQAGGK